MPQRALKHSPSSHRIGKQDRVHNALRGQIVQGRLRAGQQLPPIPVLARQLGVSGNTIQLAIIHLVREGFVEVVPRKGTFVRQQLPQTRYGLVFFNDPTAPSWSGYYVALANAALSLEREQGYELDFFYGVDGRSDSADAQRLEDSVRAHRLSGLIFANNPPYPTGLPVLDAHGLPLVAIMSGRLMPEVAAVVVDGERLYERALDHLLARGCRRIATISNYFAPGSGEDRGRAVAARGLAVPSYWWQYAQSTQPSAVRNCVELLMHSAAGDRPDGLIITDDNLVEHSLAGLIAAGVRVPQDVEVVVHCNFPWAPPCVLPVKRIGFDIVATLRTCVGLIERQRQGESVPSSTVVPPIFEEELVRPAAPPRGWDQSALAPGPTGLVAAH